MNSFERQQMIERLRESSAELRADIECRQQQLEDDPYAFDDFVRQLCSEPIGSPVVRSAGPTAGLVYKTKWDALQGPARAAPAALSADMEMIGEAVAIALDRTVHKLKRDYQRQISGLRQRVEELEAERAKIVELPALPLRGGRGA